jgi:cysteine desulfurase
MPKEIYLDNSMTTRPSERSISKMMPFYTERWGHPSAPHQKGQELYPAMTESFKAIYAMLGAKDEDDFVFTSSGAEAVNHVILAAYMDITIPTGKNQYIVSSIDEAPPIMAVSRLERFGCVAKSVHPCPQGKILAESIAEAITPRTALVSLGWAHGLTGVVNPVAEISQLCQKRGIALHLEATHILGKLFYEMEDIGAHFITFNGDHLHAPKGTGGLYIKAGIKCSPFILGGIEQAGQRAGSFNVAGLAALGQSAHEVIDSRDLLCTEVARLRNKFELGVTKGFSEAEAFFTDQERLPNCSVIGFPGIANESLLFALNRKGVYASIGGGSFQQLGLVLKASGIPESIANSAISFALSRETTEEEIDGAIDIVVESAKKLRKISGTLYTKGGQ